MTICALKMKASHVFLFFFLFSFLNAGMLDKNRQLHFSGRCVTFSLLFISRVTVSVINALE